MTPGRRRALQIAVAGTAAAAGAGLAWRRWQVAEPAPDAAAALWDLRFERPAGGTVVMADLRGKPLLINFWATWCAPCIRELPVLQRFAQHHAARGWQVLALAVDQPVPVIEFVARFKLELPVAMAGIDGLEWQRAAGNAQGGLPFSVAFDAQGRLRQRRLGETNADELARWAAEITPDVPG